MDDYSDIINLPHQEPQNRQRMSMQARAAQFAPFAALTGHSEAIEETARKVENEVNQSEYERFRQEQMEQFEDDIAEGRCFPEMPEGQFVRGK